MLMFCRCDLDKIKREYEVKTNEIVNDLYTKGYCDLLDNVMKSSQLDINYIEYYSLQNALNFLDKGEEIELNLLDKVDPNVSGQKSNYTLGEMAYMKINRKRDIQDYRIFQLLVTIGRKKHLEYIENIKNNNVIYTNKDTVLYEKGFEEPLINAKTEAEKIIHQAEDEAKRIKKDAECYAEDCKKQAMLSAEQVYHQELTENKERLDKVLSKHLGKQQFDLSNGLRELKVDFLEDQKSDSVLRSAILEEVFDKTSNIQSCFISKIDEQIQSLNQFKIDLHNDLRRWQMQFNYNDIQKLARLYIEFYQIINIDSIISQEFLKQLKEKNNSSVLEELLKMKNTLEKYLVKFEHALSGVGLYVYYPKEDDEYNEVLHKVYQHDEENEIVSRCIIPGVKQVSNVEVEGKVIIPAIVELK